MQNPRVKMRADSVYKSKVDTWLIGVFAVTSLMAVGAVLPSLRHDATTFWLVALPTLTFALGLPTWLFFSTDYTLTTEELRIRSGPFRWIVPLSSITAVHPTRNPLSSPALSLDRLRIDYAGRFVMISPLERSKFLEDLESRGVKMR